ncbi:hypothetical protein [Stenotrophomonas sp.]|uniref:hypothetical protein n=1 Tax=Stenotrophomonas sp. TaxID=69392 RepID=UPI00289C0C11|nr:hypothetical protein [Stenotrophomonas sp.]
MCGKPKTPKVVERDPVAEQRAAEAQAATQSNLEIASRRRRLRESSLLTMGAKGFMGSNTRSLLASAIGKSTLGGQ